METALPTRKQYYSLIKPRKGKRLYRKRGCFWLKDLEKKNLVEESKHFKREKFGKNQKLFLSCIGFKIWLKSLFWTQSEISVSHVWSGSFEATFFVLSITSQLSTRSLYSLNFRTFVHFLIKFQPPYYPCLRYEA